MGTHLFFRGIAPPFGDVMGTHLFFRDIAPPFVCFGKGEKQVRPLFHRRTLTRDGYQGLRNMDARGNVSVHGPMIVVHHEGNWPTASPNKGQACPIASGQPE